METRPSSTSEDDAFHVRRLSLCAASARRSGRVSCDASRRHTIGARHVRIASWNVESIRSHHDQVIAWIDANDIDVLCMQETKAGHRKFPQQAFLRRGFELHIHGGDDGRGGVALASRLPTSDVDLGIPGAIAPLDEPRALAATIDGARIHTAYAPNGRKVGTHPHQIKLAWFALFYLADCNRV